MIDALRLPKHAGELGGIMPEEGEMPFFCLLEDDRLITKLAVETDWLLDPLTDSSDDMHTVRPIIKVTIRPDTVTTVNMNFA